MSSRLFGQISRIPEGEFGDRPRQREWVLGKAEELTMERLVHGKANPGEIRPIGIPYLAWIALEDMKRNRVLWPNIPAQDGIRKRIQEIADPRFFYPTPLVHLPIKFKEIDPEATMGVYGLEMRPTSCYLLNPFWCLEFEPDFFEMAKEFAFLCLRVSTMPDLKYALSGVNSQ